MIFQINAAVVGFLGMTACIFEKMWAGPTSLCIRSTEMADSEDIKRANEDLSRLLRSSVFPGGVYSFPKRSVTHEMLAQADPKNPEFK